VKGGRKNKMRRMEIGIRENLKNNPRLFNKKREIWLIREASRNRSRTKIRVKSSLHRRKTIDGF
jgi:hypothetical protein